MLIIGINGVAGSGKSTLANALISKLPTSFLESFAAPLKSFCMNMLDLTYEQVYGSEKNSLTKYKWKQLDHDSEYLSCHRGGRCNDFMTAREVMQWYGEYFRTVDINFYVHKLLRRAAVRRSAVDEICIVEDLRHRNELPIFNYTIHCVGKTKDSHISENDLKESSFDFYIDKTKQTVEEAATLVYADLIGKFDSKFFF